MKDWKYWAEHIAVIWALAAITPFVDIQDIFLISLLSGLIGIPYVQIAVLYYTLAVFTLIVLAPRKLKKIYEKIKRWF